MNATIQAPFNFPTRLPDITSGSLYGFAHRPGLTHLICERTGDGLPPLRGDGRVFKGPLQRALESIDSTWGQK